MPTLKLSSLASFKSYWQDIAVGPHHHVAIDGFIWGSSKVMQNANRQNASRLLWTGWYENVRFSDQDSDNTVKIKPIRVAYLVVPDGKLFSDEESAMDMAEEVIDDIVARLKRDMRGEEVAGVWQMIAAIISSISTKPIEHTIGSTRYIGWEARIDFMDNKGLAYNPAKWTT